MGVSHSRTGRFFANNAVMQTVATKNERTSRDSSVRWLRLGGSRPVDLLILHTFSKEDSEKIMQGIRRPGTFVFNNAGSIQCKHNTGVFSWRHPFDPLDPPDFLTSSLQELRNANSGTYMFSELLVITSGLRYILAYKDDQYHVLYNFMHTRQFREHYLKHMANPRARTRHFMTVERFNNSEASMEHVIGNYCRSLQVSDGRGRKRYLDPTCNILLSPKQCAGSSIRGNHVKLPRMPAELTNAMMAMSGTEGDRDNANVPGPLNCMCIGPIWTYLSTHLQDRDESFIWTFGNIAQCNPAIQQNVCHMEVFAGTMNMENSGIVNSCGAQVPHDEDWDYDGQMGDLDNRVDVDVQDPSSDPRSKHRFIAGVELPETLQRFMDERDLEDIVRYVVAAVVVAVILVGGVVLYTRDQNTTPAKSEKRPPPTAQRNTA